MATWKKVNIQTKTVTPSGHKQYHTSILNMESRVHFRTVNQWRLTFFTSCVCVCCSLLVCLLGKRSGSRWIHSARIQGGAASCASPSSCPAAGCPCVPRRRCCRLDMRAYIWKTTRCNRSKKSVNTSRSSSPESGPGRRRTSPRCDTPQWEDCSTCFPFVRKICCLAILEQPGLSAERKVNTWREETGSPFIGWERTRKWRWRELLVAVAE